MRRITPVLFAIALAIAGCTATDAPADGTPIYTIVATPAYSPTAVLSKPDGSVMIAVRGNIRTLNSPDALLLNRSMIESAGVVEYDVTDPFLQRRVVYRGVLMRDLLTLIGVMPDATTVRLIALNDYTIDVPIAELTRTPVLYAIEQDGVAMTPADRGPAMLVFPYDDFAFDHRVYEALWIWQITAMEVQ